MKRHPLGLFLSNFIRVTFYLNHSFLLFLNLKTTFFSKYIIFEGLNKSVVSKLGHKIRIQLCHKF